jgi:hypothetical protein
MKQQNLVPLRLMWLEGWVLEAVGPMQLSWTRSAEEQMTLTLPVAG